MHRSISRRHLLRSTVVLGAAGTLAACDVGSDDEPEASPPDSAPSTSAPAGPVEVPDPIDYLITRWRADRFAAGSYSYLARGSDPEDRSILAEPVDGRIFFAGEATHRDFPATVHGALLSGRRVAEEVIESGHQGVTVIGAGVAGLEAARVLRDAGRVVSVVEGRDRIGGRVWSDDSLGTPVDLGASWIHGVSGNPLTDIADAADIERVPTDYDNLIVRDADGEVLAPDDVPEEQAVVFGIEQEYAADVDDLSPEALEEGEEYSGGDVVFPGGYSELVAELYDGPVEFGYEVIEIEHSADGALVRTVSEQRPAEAVVVTVPLGVLKSGAITFEPPLPPEKVAAIDRLGMGLLDKVYLRFDEVFWDVDVEFIGHAGPSRDRFVTWLNMAFYTGEPILMAFNAASAADAVEAETDEAIVAEAMAALRRMYGR